MFRRGKHSEGDKAPTSSAHARLEELKAANPDLDIRERKKIKPWHRVVAWLLATWLLGGAVPIGSTLVHALDGHQSPNFYVLLGKGDLMVVALLASLAAFGDLALALARARFKSVFWPWFLLVSEVILMLTASIWYGDLSAQVLDQGGDNPSHPAVYASTAMYGLSAILGSICVGKAAGGE